MMKNNTNRYVESFLKILENTLFILLEISFGGLLILVFSNALSTLT